MLANISEETGISYGAVYLNSLQPWVWEEIILNAKPQEDYPEDSDIEEPVYLAEIDGVTVETFYLGGAPMLMVLDSPFIRKDTPACSPCLPNAGDLDSSVDAVSSGGTVDCYDVPKDWYCKEERN